MFAVFKRNFFAYFLNPTGYVFICVFVLLCSVAAFLPDEFISANLANLAQLNAWFPLIATVFTPAISMGVWADERRFGTDEILATQPITTFQIVFGKYLASVCVYSVSLLFSAVANYTILEFLGEPDLGLFASTYLGYWLIGNAFLAVASIFSYLTPQLTVAYILGSVFCAPFVALKWADAFPVSNKTADLLKSFSVDAFFAPFGRGCVSLSGALYFLSIACVSIYVCVVLLDRKTWTALYPKGRSCRYLFRTLAASLFLASLVGIVRDRDLKVDLTEEKLSGLSDETLALINTDYARYPIVIEARFSPNVPREFVQTRLNAISVLNELKDRSKAPIFLDIRDILPNTQEAYRLERQYDVKPRKVVFDTRGQLSEDSIFLSIIFRCGSRTVVIPFLNKGLSVEYELVSSLFNVAAPPKKRIGIVATEAGVLGRVDDYGREIQTSWPLVDELSKRYFVESVDPSKPILPGKYDVLLAFQPSALGTLETINFTNAVRQGQATLIFEDPCPVFLDFLPGTLEQRQPTPTRPIPPLKGEIDLLWMALGIRFNGADVLWKNYNPYPRLAGLSEEFLFVDAQPIVYDSDEAKQGGETKTQETLETFNSKEPIVANIERLLVPFAGFMAQAENAETNFTPLIQTTAGGYSASSDVVRAGIRTRSLKRLEKEKVYTLAAHISGQVPKAFQTPSSSGAAAPNFNVIVVSDVDMATPGFFTLRNLGVDVRTGVTFDFDNVAFLMNSIDKLADEESLVAIRSRRPKHRTLTRIEDATRKIRDRVTLAQIAYMKEYEAERVKEEEKLQKTVQELAGRDNKQKELTREESMELQSAIVVARQRLTSVLDEKKRRIDRKIEEEQREVDEFVRKIQGRYKTCAVAIPPIPPLVVGILVYFYRRKRQKTPMIERKA